MLFHRIRDDAGEKEHDDEKHDDGAEVVEAVRTVLVLLTDVADEQNLRQFTLDLVVYGTRDAVRARLDLADLEAQQLSAGLNVDQKAAVVHRVLQRGPVLLRRLHADVVVGDVL